LNILSNGKGNIYLAPPVLGLAALRKVAR